MANEIDLYKDLEQLEGFLKWSLQKGYKDTAKRAKEDIKRLTKEIKTQYPELVWNGVKI